MTKLSLMGLILATAQIAFANPEFFYQSKAEQINITPSFSYSTNSGETKNSFEKTDASLSMLNIDVEAEYGIREDMSIGAVAGFYNASTESKTTVTGGFGNNPRSDDSTSGLRNISAFFKGRYAIKKDLNARYGGMLGMGFGDNEVYEVSGLNANRNRFTMSPYVGLDYSFKSFVVGSRLLLPVYGSSYEVKNDANEYSGFLTREISAFVEMNIQNKFKVGATSGFAINSDTEIEVGNQTIDIENPNYFFVRGYGVINIGTNMAFIPTAAYYTSTSSIKNTVQTQAGTTTSKTDASMYEFGAKLRTMF